jgi:hypothetical protein
MMPAPTVASASPVRLEEAIVRVQPTTSQPIASGALADLPQLRPTTVGAKIPGHPVRKRQGAHQPRLLGIAVSQSLLLTLFPVPVWSQKMSGWLFSSLLPFTRLLLGGDVPGLPL